MLAYTFKRLIQGIVTVWFIATATFFAMHAVPGDPLADQRATTPAIRKNLEARYGLDRPVTEQYLVFLGNMLRGDFGISFTQENRRVNDIIRESFPVSATLGILAVAFAAFGGVVWGALTAIYRNRLPDLVITFLLIHFTIIQASAINTRRSPCFQTIGLEAQFYQLFGNTSGRLFSYPATTKLLFSNMNNPV